MIKNERQYRITKSQVARFEEALEQLIARPEQSTNGAKRLQKAQEDALRSQLNELQDALADYTNLRASQRPLVMTGSFKELPDALIRARIATGITQQELAERLGLKAQQVQRYEATEYASVSLSRLRRIIEALGVTVTDEVLLP